MPFESTNDVINDEITQGWNQGAYRIHKECDNEEQPTTILFR